MNDFQFRIGDLVTRDGSDVQRVVDINEAGDLIEVECLKAPSDSWCQIGEREWNLARRYSFAGPVIEGDRA